MKPRTRVLLFGPSGHIGSNSVPNWPPRALVCVAARNRSALEAGPWKNGDLDEAGMLLPDAPPGEPA